MRVSINSYIVANDVRMRRAIFKGSFFIVEGDCDARFLQSFVDSVICQLVVAHGKTNAIGALDILGQEKFAGILGLIDADYDKLEARLPQYQNLFVTDDHDIEAMLIKSPALEKVLYEFGSKDKIRRFNAQTGKDLRTVLLEGGLQIGYLRWVSLRESLSLKFEGLVFTMFVNMDTLAVNESELMRLVLQNSQNSTLTTASIPNKIDTLRRQSFDSWHVCCGHDLISILSIGFQKALGSRKYMDVRQQVLERSLRLAYEQDYFSKTQLYCSIQSWEISNKPFRVLRATSSVYA